MIGTFHNEGNSCIEALRVLVLGLPNHLSQFSRDVLRHAQYHLLLEIDADTSLSTLAAGLGSSCVAHRDLVAFSFLFFLEVFIYVEN